MISAVCLFLLFALAQTTVRFSFLVLGVSGTLVQMPGTSGPEPGIPA